MPDARNVNMSMNSRPWLQGSWSGGKMDKQAGICSLDLGGSSEGFLEKGKPPELSSEE